MSAIKEDIKKRTFSLAVLGSGPDPDLRPVRMDESSIHQVTTEGARRTKGAVISHFTQAVKHIYHPLIKKRHTELAASPAGTNET